MSVVRKLSFVLAVLASQSAMAATVTGLTGRVVENSGAGFKPASVGESLRPGAKIMVPQNGGARLAFDDGCIIEVPAGELYIVPANDPCKAGGLQPGNELVGPVAAAGFVLTFAGIALIGHSQGNKHLSP